MNAIKWIVTEAKKIRRDHPRRFKTWREYVAQASAIYARKHKGKSPVGHKKKRIADVTTRSRTHVDKNRLTTNIQIGNVNKSRAVQQIADIVKTIPVIDRQIEACRISMRGTKGSVKASYKRELNYLKRQRQTEVKNLANLKRLL